MIIGMPYARVKQMVQIICPDDTEISTIARLKSIQRSGLLPSSNVGTGQRHLYTDEEVWFLGLLSEFHNLGVPQKAAAEILEINDWRSRVNSGRPDFIYRNAGGSYIHINFERIRAAILASKDASDSPSTAMARQIAERDRKPFDQHFAEQFGAGEHGSAVAKRVAAIRDSSEAITAALKSLLDDLTIGGPA